ncbi:hypothetical protein SAMN05444920_101705 [Nonomuraea solani]|uniref:Uncharacterized protein n=1 Tax=Nonomuraea solani TaxID=1144553 RepID=A0A1H5UZA7_9ACTN|nr:hypothetical protein [Nonomuraea solani]SEF80280.1 hypothetical protein SAMN05444920_101705 [Nonomuraea solani]
MPEPVPIKDSGLPAGDVSSYGDRDRIKQRIEQAKPGEFQPVMDAYGAASTELTEAIGALAGYAANLVADGNWGGESARAMLTRMNRLQTYMRSLRDGLNALPPGLRTVRDALVTAQRDFEGATALRGDWTEAGPGYGQMTYNDPDQEARTFMAALNPSYHAGHDAMPQRLPWDEVLASPEPYMPPIERPPAPVRGNDLPYGDTSRSGLAETSGPAAAGSQSGTSTAAAPGSPAQPTPGPTPGSAPGPTPQTPPPAAPPPVTAAPPVPAPGGTGLLSGTTPGQTGAARPGTPVTTPPGTAPPGTTDADRPKSPVPTPAATPTARRDSAPTSGQPTGNPYTTTAQEAASQGPSVRPGSVPVVDGSWPATRSPVAGAQPGTTGMAGMPFMPMGGGIPQDGQSAARRPVTSKSRDDDFFQPDVDHGPPVVG